MIFIEGGTRAVLHSFSNAIEHSVTTRQNDVAKEIGKDFTFTFHDRVEYGLMDATSFLAKENRLEENFRFFCWVTTPNTSE